jgi:glycosyltransferase involved in cell wall biosynthesis
MNTLISLLIPSLTSRAHLLSELKKEIARQQSCSAGLEILANIDAGQKPVGQKRNELLLAAKGEYVAFIDDDDLISRNYLAEIRQALTLRPDCVGFEGFITVNGRNKQKFKISKAFDYQEVNMIYYRPINHLCPVRKEIALAIRYPNKNCGEDYDYCMRLKHSGLLKNEVYIAKELYHYRFDSRATATQQKQSGVAAK